MARPRFGGGIHQRPCDAAPAKGFVELAGLDHGLGDVSPPAETYRHWMLQKDPPDLTRLRNLAASDFAPRLVTAMETQIQDLVNELIDRVAADGRMDLVRDLAYPLPIRVICQLLGVPAEDHGHIRDWSEALHRP